MSVDGRPMRDGGQREEEMLAEAWTRLGFEVRVGLSPSTQSRDLTSREILQVLEQMSSEDFEDASLFGCAVLSHASDNECLLGSDGLPVSVAQIAAIFSGDRCKGLRGKPKMFFFQISHTKKIMTGLLGRSSRQQETSRDSVNDLAAAKKFPVCVDSLISTAIVGASPSLRFQSTGSWYIQALTEALNESGDKTDMLTLLTRVNLKIQAKEFPVLPVHKEWTPVRGSPVLLPSCLSQLTRDLYLNSAVIPSCRYTQAAPPPNAQLIEDLLESPKSRRKALKLYKQDSRDSINV